LKDLNLKSGASVALLLLHLAPVPLSAQPLQTPQTTQPQQPAGAPAAPAATQQTPGSQQPTVAPSPTQPAAPQPIQNSTTGAPGLPPAPTPKPTEPLYLRDTNKDYTHLKTHTFRHLFAPYTPTALPDLRLSNTPKLDDLLRDGKLYLSLSDAVTLALENNYDIAIARINLDIADTDILRTKAGSSFRGVSTGLITNTLGGSTSTITTAGGPGGTSAGSSGAGAGTSGLVLSTNGGGPQPYLFDPSITGALEYERANTQQSSTLITGTNSLNQDTATANATYTQGFATGGQLTVTFDNSRITTNSERSSYSPLLQSSYRAEFNQHLLQGFGFKLNRRFIIEAINNRRITDSSFRQQVIYTVNQVENIYWALVSAYEDEQAKERALEQSTQLTADNRKQLEIGTLAPLDVVNSDSAVATDKQALINSKSNLEYQQLLMKQAIARNLDDPQLANAPVVPTDRVALDRLPEEDEKVEDLVKEAYTLNPQIEQAVISLENNKITIAGEKNGLLPIIDGYAFYGTSGIGGQQNPNLNCSSSTSTSTFVPCPPNSVSGTQGYGGVVGNLITNNNPDYGVGVNVTIPLRNRVAQADQARSQMEYRQTQMRLQQLYTQIKIEVINAQYALTNDRANVQAAQTARDFDAQSLAAEQKKYKLGASTTANVLSQERTLATGENNLISATAAYARDRAALQQILSNTLDRYGISLVDAATGKVTQPPSIPGLTTPKAPEAPKPLSPTPPPPPAQ
jgi:outer membrane protein TolC